MRNFYDFGTILVNSLYIYDLNYKIKINFFNIASISANLLNVPNCGTRPLANTRIVNGEVALKGDWYFIFLEIFYFIGFKN